MEPRRRHVGLDVGADEAPVPATAVRPQPVPLDVKLVLVGTEGLYQTLFELDPGFRELLQVTRGRAMGLP